MRILFAGYRNPHFPTITEFYERAIVSLGHEVAFFHDRQFLFPQRLRSVLPIITTFDLFLLNQRLIARAKTVKPDLFLALGGNRVIPAAVTSIHKMGIKTTLMTVDPPVDFSAERKAAPHYDYVFCGGSEAVEILQKDGVTKAHWLPFACDPQGYHPVPVSDEERKKNGHDVLFIGSYYPNRWEILRQLKEFDVGIYGPGWAKADVSNSGSISIREEQMPFDTQLSLYSSAKIVVIIHYQDGKTPCYQASPKVYEALACKCFVLVDRQRDVFSIFKNSEHLVGFDSVEDLKIKLKYYLDKPEERVRIAAKGYTETISRHTYRHRIADMMRAIQCGSIAGANETSTSGV